MPRWEGGESGAAQFAAPPRAGWNPYRYRQQPVLGTWLVGRAEANLVGWMGFQRKLMFRSPSLEGQRGEPELHASSGY